MIQVHKFFVFRRTKTVTTPQMDVNIIRRSFKLICRASAGAHVKMLGPVQDARTSTSADMRDKESSWNREMQCPKRRKILNMLLKGIMKIILLSN